MLVDVASSRTEVEVGQRRVVGRARGDEDVVDRLRQLGPELRESVEVGGIEGRGAGGPEVGCRSAQPVGVAAGDDDVGAFEPRQPGGLEPDASAPADQHDGLSVQPHHTASSRERAAISLLSDLRAST